MGRPKCEHNNKICQVKINNGLSTEGDTNGGRRLLVDPITATFRRHLALLERIFFHGADH